MIDKKKILYIDDDQLNLTIFKLLFKSSYDIIVADNADLGLDILEKDRSIDLIITDMNMPGKNGLEFLEIANERFPYCHYFMLTGYEVTADIQSALDKKLMIKCFKKPLDKALISLAIKECESNSV